MSFLPYGPPRGACDLILEYPSNERISAHILSEDVLSSSHALSNLVVVILRACSNSDSNAYGFVPAGPFSLVGLITPSFSSNSTGRTAVRRDCRFTFVYQKVNIMIHINNASSPTRIERILTEANIQKEFHHLLRGTLLI